MKDQEGERNFQWKGDKVSYRVLHKWIKKHKPKKDNCENCFKTNKKLDLANISGKYKRDINDFEWLCRKCHMRKDGRLDKLHSYNKGRPAWNSGLKGTQPYMKRDKYGKFTI